MDSRGASPEQQGQNRLASPTLQIKNLNSEEEGVLMIKAIGHFYDSDIKSSVPEFELESYGFLGSTSKGGRDLSGVCS
ncbi:uncharacterized protein PADG_03585 [Paracoccidioides brasiliensis Pb18]|uniref:Uncharacterized protein n=1 Tax=Paracoccidioides brasiliensis (strain Pb18) TaxID=502780 RepID=C1G8J9_PARBD|nr:uncharacterized protein PADG_03585 [Paracoccidioides brasiliensis Pb18]EEH47501.2 hypothetical protein PADG_03585 [Paracoccidioides brasiliensis Pb18]